jgi:hypothetical protein
MIAKTKRTPEEIQEAAIQKYRKDVKFQFEAGCAEIIPAKYRDVRLSQLQPSKLSRLPFEDQVKLYKDVNEKKLEGWAFFAPAGYSKTTVSWGLFKYALLENLQIALWTGKSEYVRRGCMEGPRLQNYNPCYVYQESVPEWLEKIQASWGEERVAPPRLNFEQIARAERDGFRPRVFLEEIDKIKEGSEWNTNKIFTLLNAVDKHKGQLVLDTNLSRRQFMDRFGEAIYRRVKENCNMREFGFQ